MTIPTRFATAPVTVDNNPLPMAATNDPIPIASAPETSAPALAVDATSATALTRPTSVTRSTPTITRPVPTVTAIAANPRLSPRRCRAAAAGSRVAARITAMTTGMITPGKSSATWVATPNRAATMSARQLHWARRSSQTGTMAEVVDGVSAAMGSRPRAVIRTPTQVWANASIGRITTRPPNPPIAYPIGRPSTAGIGCSSRWRPDVTVARARSTAMQPRTNRMSRADAGPAPDVANAINESRNATSPRPIYGTNEASRATTANGPANGTPRTDNRSPVMNAVAAAITAVPRMYPPTWWSEWRPPVMRACCRQPSVEDSNQSQHRSPSTSRKNVRNPPRIATVTTVAAALTKLPSPPRTIPRIDSAMRWRIVVTSAGTPRAASCSTAEVIPASNAATIAFRDGTIAMTTNATVAPRMSSPTSETTPAALARPQPRARRSMTYGASVAARIRATMIDAATVNNSTTIDHRTNPRASVTRTRQPIAARRASQPGTRGSSVETPLDGWSTMRSSHLVSTVPWPPGWVVIRSG